MTPEQLEKEYLRGEFTLKSEFMKSNYKREETLTRCERYAGWTLPNLFPEDPLMEYDEMQNDYQSVGAQATIHLANKIMMALFQPSHPFFKMELSTEQKVALLATGMQEADIEAALAKAERTAMHTLTTINARVVLTDAIQHLIVTGNSLLHTPKEGNMQNYSLRDYVIVRDLQGTPVKIIVRETKAVEGLTDKLAGAAKENNYGAEAEVTIYTCILLVRKNRYIVWQEMEDVCYCHEKMGSYTTDTLPWIPLAWNLCRNKDYATGHVENYAGDFHTLSTLAEAILDYSTIVTDIKYLVDPAGMTDVKTLNEAPSGAYVTGREGDVFPHAANVQDATQFLEGRFDSVTRRIGAAFLLNTAVTRDAERVTAEEIRMQAQELEGSLGGVYSRLATELQLPLAKRLLKRVDPIFSNVEPVVVTGLESLSRNSELDRLRFFFRDLVALADVPDNVAARIDYGNLISVLGAGHGVEFTKFLKSEAQVKQDQEAQAAQNAQAVGQEAGAVAQAEGNVQQPA